MFQVEWELYFMQFVRFWKIVVHSKGREIRKSVCKNNTCLNKHFFVTLPVFVADFDCLQLKMDLPPEFDDENPMDAGGYDEPEINEGDEIMDDTDIFNSNEMELDEERHIEGNFTIFGQFFINFSRCGGTAACYSQSWCHWSRAGHSEF